MTAELLETPYRNTPSNLDAEQALLGALLMHQETFRYINPKLAPEHFYEPVHQRIFAAMLKMHEEGRAPTPLTLMHRFDNDPGLSEIGGGKYLQRLMSAAITVINVTDVSDVIFDLALRRRLADACQLTLDRLLRGTEYDNATEAAAELRRNADELVGIQDDGKFEDNYQVGARILESMENKEAPHSTGIPKLDECMGGGLYPGYSYGFCARKKVGKTMLAGTISHNLNKQGVRHLFICGEMSAEQIEQRNLCRELGLHPSVFRVKGNTWPEQQKIAAAIEKGNRCCIYRKAAGLTFAQLRQFVTTAVERREITGFVLDYWQLVGGKPPKKSTAEHLDEVAQWIADYCRRENIWNIVMGQINQEGNTRGGEGMRLAFDQVYCIHRPDITAPGMWLEMMETRYTEWKSIGSKAEPGFLLNENGPYFELV
jgi:replicative DNA helicase